MWRGIGVSNGNVVELKVNGATVCYLNTTSAISIDYLSFIDKTIEILMNDKTSLELEANTKGKTLNHEHSAFSTIKDPKGL